MKHLATIIVVVAMAASPVLAKPHTPPPAVPAGPAGGVIAAERDFDAYTAVHGYSHGFYTYSSPVALSFEPGPAKTHDDLAAAQAGPENDAPSSLRWWPTRAGIAASGDLAYDIGGWAKDGNPDGGWFLSVWQKQPDDSWLWLIDTAAGAGPVASLPGKDSVTTDIPPFAASATPQAAVTELNAADRNLDTALAAQEAATAYNGFLTPISTVAQDGGAPATDAAAIATVLAARPGGLTWSEDGVGMSQAGDFGYTYGHAATGDATATGWYVRVWRKDADGPTGWRIIADVFHAAR